MIGFATWETGINTKKGACMRQDTAKVHEIVSKVIVTNDARPELVQALLSWVKDTVTTIIYKAKF